MAEEGPLLATNEAPAPAGARAEWFEGAHRARLRAALFPARGTARGSVVLSPGRTEPIEKYFETAGDLNARGWTVVVHDWRGQGLSVRALDDRTAGHAEGFADFLVDYERLLSAFESRLPGPRIALGHSMGGCLTLLALARGERRFSGAILSAPMLGLVTGATPVAVGRAVARVHRLLGRGGKLLAGAAAREVETFETNVLTHDRRRWERNQALVSASPELALGPPTWGWLDFAFSAIAVLQRGREVGRLALPVTIAAAGEEKLVANAAARRIAARIGGARYVEIPGAYHEILQETDPIRAAFFAEFEALAERARA
ncbi:MAG: alpha/beta fold hydrolase [Caulobacteraceae bacterium]